MIKTTYVLITVLFSNFVYSQKAWTLEECLKYADENQTKIKIAQLEIDHSDISLKQAKFNYLPNLNAGITHGYNWGQSIDPFTNQFATNRVRTNNLYMSSSWSIFSGFKNYYIQKKTESEKQFFIYNLEVERRNLKIDVSAAYLQAVLSFSIWQIKSEELQYGQKQRNRIQSLVEFNYSTNNDYLEIHSQVTLDSVGMIQAESEYQLSLLQLKQLLNIQIQDDFAIQLKDFEFEESIAVNQNGYENLPELKAIEVRQEINNTDIKIAHGSIYPSLKLNASMGSGYSGNNLEVVGSQLEPKSFSRQLGENFYQTATVSLSIPIFNNWSVGADIQRTKIEIERANLEKSQLLLDLTYKLGQLQIETKNIQNNIEALKIAVNATQASFESAKIKYENGYLNITDFIQIKNNLFKAKEELAQSETEHKFKKLVLGFYSN